jgi:hypothetical protein
MSYCHNFFCKKGSHMMMWPCVTVRPFFAHGKNEPKYTASPRPNCNCKTLEKESGCTILFNLTVASSESRRNLSRNKKFLIFSGYVNAACRWKLVWGWIVAIFPSIVDAGIGSTEKGSTSTKSVNEVPIQVGMLILLIIFYWSFLWNVQCVLFDGFDFTK